MGSLKLNNDFQSAEQLADMDDSASSKPC